MKKGSRILAVGGIAFTLNRLERGVRLSPPKIETKPFALEDDIDTLLHQAEADHAISLSTEDRLFVETSFEFFKQKGIKESHRSGNSIKEIKKAFKKGAQIFDIDANDIDGTIYGEHGLVPSMKLWKLKVNAPFVLDVDEKEFKLGKPDRKFEELIRYIGKLSTPERPLGVKIELKRGEFNEGTMNEMFGSLEEFNVPAVVLTRGPREFELAGNIRMVRNNNSVLLGQMAS